MSFLKHHFKVSFRSFFIFLWESPTLMTWGSFLTRSLSAVLVLPLVLRSFQEEEITLWLMFAQIISLQLLVDMGFTPTFARLIAYAKGGIRDIIPFLNPKNKDENTTITTDSEPNWELIGQIRIVMQKVYTYMTLISFGLLLTVGTYFVYEPIQRMQSKSMHGWIAWGMIVFTSLFYLRGNQYSACLQGINQVATLRRWEVLVAMGGIVSSLVVLLADGGLLGMVIASQVWVILGIGLNYWLSNKYIPKVIVQEGISSQTMFLLIWQKAWRSGVGVLISFGTLRFASLYIGGGVDSAQAAMFLLGLRIVEMLNEFAQAPVYSKLPRLAKLYAERNLGVMMGVAKQGMTRSHWIFVGAFIVSGLVGNFALAFIGSKTQFPQIHEWCILGLAYFFQRFGAMHLHLFSTTNQIIWHKVNGITGLIFLIIFFLTYQYFPIYSYAIALLSSSLLFYAWYCAYRTYKEFNLQWWSFEKTVALAPFLLLLIFTSLAFAGYLSFLE
ncbi:MAG: hypothetical protein MUE81_15100 [Thermoflexibacter sp.]|jgi:O-antigen/teichoic acid export membrane protein|nr:hypothetical protein [Thermoflexibacter sp.]